MKNDEISEKIKKHMKELNIPGVAVGIRHGDKTFTKGFGVTNVDHPLPVDENTLFQIGSITKTFIGTIAMMLIEKGKLDLDEPIQTYLPGFKVQDHEASTKVTMRHLFTHTAGWVGDWFPAGLDHGIDAVKEYVKTMHEDPQLTPLGEVLSYNNAGFNLTGNIFEAITGKIFSDLIKEMIFQPLEMNHTYILPWDVMTHRFAVGHTPDEEEIKVAQPWSIGRASGPAGGIITNVRDMLNYAKFHLRDGTYNNKKLLEPESLKKLHTPQVKFAPHNSVALTFWVDDRRAARTMGHGGGTVGQISSFTLVPEHDFSILLVTNSSSGRQFNPKVTNWILKHYLDLDTPELEPMEMTEEQLSEYTGEYLATLSEAKVEVNNGKLSISKRSLGGFPTRDIPPATTEWSPPVPYGFYDKDHIVGLEDPSQGVIGQFLRDKEGKITWLRTGMRIHRLQ